MQTVHEAHAVMQGSHLGLLLLVVIVIINIIITIVAHQIKTPKEL